MFFFQRWLLKNTVIANLVSKIGVRGKIIKIGDSDLWCDFFGDKNNPALLLLMGGGCQGIIWTEAFCEKLAALGLFVIRFDQRDTGLSSYFKKHYTLLDMAKDVVNLLDQLNIKKAHLMGISMGGAIAQIIATHFSSYVNELVLVATTNNFYPIASAMKGEFHRQFTVSSPEPEWFEWVGEMERMPFYAFRKRMRKQMDGWRILNGKKTEFPYKYYDHLLKESIKRQRSYKALLNHRSALLSSLDLLLATNGKINTPTLIIHGGCDPLFPKDHAESLSSSIPSSKLLLIEEMGHNFCPCFHDVVIKEIEVFLKP